MPCRHGVFPEKCLAALDDSYKSLEEPAEVAVRLSDGLQALQRRAVQERIEKEPGES